MLIRNVIMNWKFRYDIDLFLVTVTALNRFSNRHTSATMAPIYSKCTVEITF